MPIETNSKIDLISKALILCGEKPLISLSDDRYGATVGANLFEMLYENEVQSNRWRFAMTKVALGKLAAAPLNQWKNAFQLPPDMLLPIGVFPADLNYEIYVDHLYTDRTTVELDYMFKPVVTSIPAYFATLMTYSLARHFYNPITEGSAAQTKLMVDRYDKQRGIAMYADAQGRPAKATFSDPFINTRSA